MLWRKLLEWPEKLWPDAVDNGKRSDLQTVNLFVLPFLSICGFAVLWFFGFTRNAGVALMWALASLSAGGAVGFLFGIPRSAASNALDPTAPRAPPAAGATAQRGAKPALRPNTNLEEVSDWLTKIIVGLGLVNLKDIQGEVGRISANVAAGWTNISTAQGMSIATALVSAFAVVGFLGAYVYTRLFLQGAFVRGDNELGGIVDLLQDTLPPAPTDPSVPAVVTAPELKVAEQVRQVARPEDMPVLLDKMRELAHEYEQIRLRDAGHERTQLMANVVQKMRSLALATLPALKDFAASRSAGERLAAVAMLQTRFDTAYTGWLAERLVEERPFLAFNAASALFSASKNLAGSSLRELFEQVRRAQVELVAKDLPEPDRDVLIAAILKQDPASKDTR